VHRTAHQVLFVCVTPIFFFVYRKADKLVWHDKLEHVTYICHIHGTYICYIHVLCNMYI
jgi:hypothetical protein